MSESGHSNKPLIYRAKGKEGPGRYYYISTKKLVPGQTTKEGKENGEFDIGKYEVVERPGRSTGIRQRLTYEKLRQEAPGVVKRLTLLEINNIGLRNGWKLSARCQKAMSVWGKSKEELMEIMEGYRERHPECNYLDYDYENNEFIVKWRKPVAEE